MCSANYVTVKLVYHRTTSLMINRLCIKHEEKTAETENIQSLITSLALNQQPPQNYFYFTSAFSQHFQPNALDRVTGYLQPPCLDVVESVFSSSSSN